MDGELPPSDMAQTCFVSADDKRRFDDAAQKLMRVPVLRQRGARGVDGSRTLGCEGVDAMLVFRVLGVALLLGPVEVGVLPLLQVAEALDEESLVAADEVVNEVAWQVPIAETRVEKSEYPQVARRRALNQ